MVSAAVVLSKTDAVSGLVNEGAWLIGWAGGGEPPLLTGVVELPPPPPPQEPRRRTAIATDTDFLTMFVRG